MLQTFNAHNNLIRYYIIIIFILYRSKLGLDMCLVYLDTFSKWQRQEPITIMIHTLQPFIHEIQYSAPSLLTHHRPCNNLQFGLLFLLSSFEVL